MKEIVKSVRGLSLTDAMVDDIRVHTRAEHMAHLPVGPFVRLDGGDLLSVAGSPAQVCISGDEGRTWNRSPMFGDGTKTLPADTGALIKTTRGTVIAAFADLSRKKWTWQNDLKDAPGAVLPTCVARSVDNGRTWQDLQTLHDDWTGATRNMIQLRDGRVVFTSMKMRHNPGRHSVLCYYSDDDGVTWTGSNVMDLGGNGHHDGVTEGTIVELSDGSLLQYMRTNWGQLWRAASTDGGATWYPYGPTGIPASSTPALLKRMASGRIALLWNRPFAAGTKSVTLQGGDGIWSATPASNFRAELSLSFSEDECRTWRRSTVIARSESNPEKRSPEVCYPYAFEPVPGILWITAHRWDLRMRLREDDFLN